MRVRKTLDQIKKMEKLTMSELAEYNGLRYATIKFYCELGLLPVEQKEARLCKYYPRIEATARIKEIMKLKKQRKSIKEIVALLVKK
jgi:DNA-binding transcriptional MerR regulator